MASRATIILSVLIGALFLAIVLSLVSRADRVVAATVRWELPEVGGANSEIDIGADDDPARSGNPEIIILKEVG